MIPPVSEDLEQVFAYHLATKHHFHAYARGPGYLDWATQPEAFRRYQGAPLFPLERVEPDDDAPFQASLVAGHIPPAPVNHHSLSQLFFDSLAISAWKKAGNVSWALRVNPSSGNLHPTEGYLVCGTVDGLNDSPVVCHYTPREHALEQRARFPLELWDSLTADLPSNTLLVGLASIHWREAWKYGERAFRYCQHDVGHAIGAIGVAAAGLGWQVTLLDELGTEQIALLLGLQDLEGAEAEHADCLLAVYPQDQVCLTHQLPADALASFEGLSWLGKANRLSPRHVDWPIIDDVAAATLKPPTTGIYESLEEVRTESPSPEALHPPHSAQSSLRRILRQRRSAVAMDGRTRIGQDTFYWILGQTLPGLTRFPLNALPWSPRVHLTFFVHRVQGLEPGLYLLVRDPVAREALQTAMSQEFDWEQPADCPAGLELYLLKGGDMRATARQLSCHQEIASDGCFSLGMIADFEGSLLRFGPWFYPRLFWECGAIGQVLYLAAEAAGVRGTGIGCFFDDPVHRLLGFASQSLGYQSLYHFTVGGWVEDKRLTTLPAYPRRREA
jgi:SagB-type dehydrogenase family enzyme